MTAQVVTITSGKGGVGKTTAVANLAVALAADGRKVVCMDGDIGLRNLDVVMGLENRIVYDTGLRIGEDYLLLASVLAAGGKGIVVPEAGYNYHIQQGSISRVLHVHHVDAMLAGDRRFLAHFPLEGAAAAAQRRRTRNLEETRAFLALVQHLKNRSLGPALKVALGDPVALRHLSMPIAARWRHLTAPSASHAAAASGQPFKNKG